MKIPHGRVALCLLLYTIVICEIQKKMVNESLIYNFKNETSIYNQTEMSIWRFPII